MNNTTTTADDIARVAATIVAAVATNSSLNASSSSSSTAFKDVCESCGWLAAIAAMFAFGSFGVPIKSEACQHVQVDPLVFQSYKTFMCFLTSWLILFFGYEFTFTPWGIVSGLFWVPGGIATIWAIQCAGLATAIGFGSTGIVLVSFTWGIFIFQEPVRSKWGACGAVALMILGLFGMAHNSTPTPSTTITADAGAVITITTTPSNLPPPFLASTDDEHHPPQQLPQPPPLSKIEARGPKSVLKPKRRTRQGDYRGVAQATDRDDDDTTDDGLMISNHGRHHHHHLGAAIASSETPFNDDDSSDASTRSDTFEATMVSICNGNVKLTRRQVGICAAIFNGAWGGSIMAPMKWCHREDTHGLRFLLSFSIGASIVNLALWVILYFYLLTTTTTSSNNNSNNGCYNWYQAYQMLPSFHLKTLWKAGGTCGLVWSLGNFFSLISVEYLGQGVGYSVIQASMLVAGLWGIFYFREVTRPMAIVKWFLSALLTISGILLLSYEHHAKR